MDDLSADISTTGLLTVNGTVFSSIDFDGDNDWLRVSLFAGTAYTFTVGGYSTNGMGLLDPVIEGLRNANGLLIPNTYRDDGPDFSLDPQLIYTPAASGTYFLFVRSYANRGVGTYSVTVLSSNTPPTSSPAELSVPEDGVVTGTLPSAFDADGDTTTFSLHANAANGQALVSANGEFSYTPLPNFSGSDTFLFKVQDSRGGSTVYTASVSVAPVNDAPTGGVTINGTVSQGRMLSAANTLADVDGIPTSGSGAVTYQWKAAGVPIDGATSSFYRLTQSDVGKVITVSASYTDGGGTAEAVTSAATAPVAASTGVVQGIVYHWKSHMLIGGVNVSLAPPTAAQSNSTELFDLRAARFDATSNSLSLEVWANAASASFGNYEFRVVTPGATSATFTNANPSTWTVAMNPADPGNVLVAGVSGANASGSLRLGTLQLGFATGTNYAEVAFSQIKVGAADGANQGLAMQARGTALADGAYSFTSLGADAMHLSVSRVPSDTGNAITSADALAALRLAVGLNPNPDPDGAGPRTAPAVSPYQIMAADVIGTNGQITSADALAILRMAVKLPTAPAQEWLFVEERRDFWDEANQKFTLSRLSTNWDRNIAVNPSTNPVNLVAVLKGDVNGNWAAPAGSVDLDSLAPTYFDELALLMGLPNKDQWGGGP